MTSPSTARRDAGQPCTGFEQFSLTASIQRGIAGLGFTIPRPIQAQTIPGALAGRDVLGLAQTGTGKTAAFALPILERLNTRRRRGARALIVAPTRELAMQIQAEIVSLLGRLRAAIPGLVMRTTFIIGFPGETDRDFETLLEFLREHGCDVLQGFHCGHPVPAKEFRWQDSRD